MALPLKVAIIGAARTAVGRAVKGSLKDTRPEDMVSAAMQAALARAKGVAASDIGDVTLGIAMPEAEQGLNMARQAVFRAGWPDEVPGQVVNRFCSSGLQAIAIVGQAIHSKQYKVGCAGGVESMSMVPMSGNKVSLHPELIDQRPEIYIGMGHTAERIAKRFDVSADTQNQFAVDSHKKAARAQAEGEFTEQIAPLQARVFHRGKAATKEFATDELVRPDTTLEGLKKLKPAFTAGGSVTAGNSSPLSDGGAALIMADDAYVQERKLAPLGYLRAFVVCGVPPDIMGIGPYPAVEKLLKECNLTVNDIDLFEMNEAFAAQAVYCQRMLKIPDDKLNVNGGAIALGHPLGCTGAKLSVQVLYALRRRKGRLGVVTMCIGGGMGAAGLFEIL